MAKKKAPPPPPKKKRLRKLVTLVLLLAFGYVLATFGQVWMASSANSERQADAIIVLGAAQYNGKPSPALEGRLTKALLLYNAKLAPVIVVTGGRQDGDKFTEATAGYNWLREKGVPDSAIRKEVQGHTTYESIAAAAEFLLKEKRETVLMVSDNYHSYRVAAIAKEVGLKPYVVGVNNGASNPKTLAREAAAVGLGRVFGFRRADRLAG